MSLYCEICGKDLSGGWYLPKWKKKCYDCWKKTEHKIEPIWEKIKRLKEKGVI